MFPSQLRHLRDLVSVILGGIETNNLEVSVQAIERLDAELAKCESMQMRISTAEVALSDPKR